jgi:hypothetical protein
MADDEAVGFYDVSAEIMALIVAGILVLIMRWVFAPSRPRSAPPVDASDARELGLLAVVATRVQRSDATRLREVLTTAGIRSSASRRNDGTLDVLVFAEHAGQARALIDADRS